MKDSGARFRSLCSQKSQFCYVSDLTTGVLAKMNCSSLDANTFSDESLSKTGLFLKKIYVLTNQHIPTKKKCVSLENSHLALLMSKSFALQMELIIVYKLK